MFNLMQLPDLIDSAKSIGLYATITLVILLALLTSFTLMIKWLMSRIDKKDEQILKTVEDRREDLREMERAMRETASALDKATDRIRSGFDDLIREVRR